ncbi:hypothetical protein L1987_31253 [Smallanthus sonchifolius]|uniref:Uncharacterized protein n=1 Tax=Smallanthus sonchifolius TaxID=185202 RepID=A0ACB9I521_9ASTR|nr:hypothetical protein L1987_31253 [Smallanthus sonchifolius]
MPPMDPSSLKTFSDVALECLHYSREQRPTISSLVKMLENALKFPGGNDMNLTNAVGTSQKYTLVDELFKDHGLFSNMARTADEDCLYMVSTFDALGYHAPEVSILKNYDAKAVDVYSFGVIMLELLTGKSPREIMNGLSLPQWVLLKMRERLSDEVFDPALHAIVVRGDKILNCLVLALQCFLPSPTERPDIQLVLLRLETIIPETNTSSGDDGGDRPSLS